MTFNFNSIYLISYISLRSRSRCRGRNIRGTSKSLLRHMLFTLRVKPRKTHREIDYFNFARKRCLISHKWMGTKIVSLSYLVELRIASPSSIFGRVVIIHHRKSFLFCISTPNILTTRRTLLIHQQGDLEIADSSISSLYAAHISGPGHRA